MYKHRSLESHIVKLSKSFPVILLTGARQVGKTTLLKYLANKESPKRNYVTLDEFGSRALANEDPALFLERFTPPLIIDEIQYAPGLLQMIKVNVDRAKKNGQYWLTGSQHFSLMKGVSESLAGRVGIVKLLGLSQGEEFTINESKQAFRPDRKMSLSLKQVSKLSPLFQRIVRGTFPVFTHKDSPPVQVFHGSYFETYIERDIRNITKIMNISSFEKFLRLAAARVGQLLNLSELARDAQIAVSTAKEWISILEECFQVYLLRPYFENISKRQLKTPKLYFLDTGFACYLTGWHNAEVASKGAMAGNLLENYAVSEIIKSYWHRGIEAPIWFWRTKEGKEVDLIIDEDGKLFPIEIKLTVTPDNKSLKGINSFTKLSNKTDKGAVICLAEKPIPLDKNIDVIPLSHIN